MATGRSKRMIAVAMVALAGVLLGVAMLLANEHDKGLLIAARQSAHDVFPADEQQKSGGITPGYFLDDQGDPVIRIYADADVRQLGAAHVVPSKYSEAELAALEDALPRIAEEGMGSFAAGYDAEVDEYVLEGDVPPEVVERHLGSQRYRYLFNPDDPPRRFMST